MSTGSKIEWTEATWNPVTGCDWVSPGCDFCYARDLAKRLKAMGNPRYQNDGYDKALKVETLGFGVTLHEDKLDEPLGWRKPRTVFVNSMSDLFHDDVPDEFIARVFATMKNAPTHTFQILTKRPRRMQAFLSRCASWEGWVTHNAEPPAAYGGTGIIVGYDRSGVWEGPGWPLPNVWLGTSVEDQKRADLRIPPLLDTPAAVRFLSCEPLLGPVDLHGALGFEFDYDDPRTESVRKAEVPGVDWVIVGGESGPRARPMHPDWATGLRDQCAEFGVPFFFKQWGAWAPDEVEWPADDNWYGRKCPRCGHRAGLHSCAQPADGPPRSEHPEACLVGECGDNPDCTCSNWAPDFSMLRVGKKAAGRELDGRTWDEMPERVSV